MSVLQIKQYRNILGDLKPHKNTGKSHYPWYPEYIFRVNSGFLIKQAPLELNENAVFYLSFW